MRPCFVYVSAMAWLVRARISLSIQFGDKWSEHWRDAGFTHLRTNVPKRMDARICLAQNLVEFFGRQLQRERPLDQVTKAEAGAALKRMEKAQRDLRRARDRIRPPRKRLGACFFRALRDMRRVARERLARGLLLPKNI